MPATMVSISVVHMQAVMFLHVTKVERELNTAPGFGLGRVRFAPAHFAHDYGG